jgi:hypothetical protein
MERKNGSGFFSATLVASIALVVSLVTSAIVVSRAYLKKGQQHHQHQRDLKVVGSAKKRIRSDRATWKIRVAGEGKSLEEAWSKLEAAEGKVRAFMKEQEFPEAVFVAGPIATVTHYKRDAKGKETREAVSYELRRTFRVDTQEVEKVDRAAGKVTDLVRGGIQVMSVEPEYVYTKLADLKIEMMGRATANARERAEQIATKSGCRVGVVKEARAGVFQITAPWSTEVSGYGVYDTSTIEKDITAVVHLLLTIES